MNRNDPPNPQAKITEQILKAVEVDGDFGFVGLELLHDELDGGVGLHDEPLGPDEEVVLGGLVGEGDPKEIAGEVGVGGLVAQHGFVVVEGGFPPAFFDAVDALHALGRLVEDLGAYCRSLVWLPIQNPIEKGELVNEID